MTEIKARLDAIAKEAAELWESLVLAHMIKPSGEFPDQASHIRAAINQALEVVLTAEPRIEYLRAIVYKRGMLPDGAIVPLELLAIARDYHIAMTSALLEELKGAKNEKASDRS